jgi:hypothetical protein
MLKRWDLAIKKLTDVYENIVGDVLISSAIIAYMGAFNLNFRQVTCFLFLMI